MNSMTLCLDSKIRHSVPNAPTRMRGPRILPFISLWSTPSWITFCQIKNLCNPKETLTLPSLKKSTLEVLVRFVIWSLLKADRTGIMFVGTSLMSLGTMSCPFRIPLYARSVPTRVTSWTTWSSMLLLDTPNWMNCWPMKCSSMRNVNKL